MRRVRTLLVPVVGALVGLAAWPAPAAAQQDVCATHPSDDSVVCVRNNAHTVDVCDRHADGHRAYARVTTQESYPAFTSGHYDANDSQPGCTEPQLPQQRHERVGLRPERGLRPGQVHGRAAPGPAARPGADTRAHARPRSAAASPAAAADARPERLRAAAGSASDALRAGSG